jgi:dethiobiotin synthetase
MSAFFVTATGTGIGKTFVTAGLIRHLRENGQSASALKPVVSGYDKPAGSDPALLLEAMGEAVDDAAVARIAPWRFRAPLSPDMAASREHRAIDFDELVAFCRDRALSTGTLLIEGVGGVMVPLDAGHTSLDLMAALRFPAVLVTGSYLGSLSHALTAAAALERAGVKAIAIVINDTGTDEVPLTDTAATLRRFLPQHEIAILPRHADGLDFAPLAATIFREAGKRGAD